MKKNIFETVNEVLLTDSKYVAEDGKLLKATVYSDVMTMEPGLLKLLVDNEQIREKFFKDIDGVLVFDKQQFAWLIDSKEFLPDSFTSYTNKIGLASNRKFILASNDVVLDFPYKDCILQGGQDKDDQKRQEIMYNETLASDEIRNLLAPKVLGNAKRYTAVGEKDLTGELITDTIKVEEESGITFYDDDNLIIKGNNIIAISSLLKRYEGIIKLIYIDPPYNTGSSSDSFKYNDNFNESVWLTFMLNRLRLAKRLLSKDGVIFVSIDGNQFDTLSLLLKEVFGKENLLEVFHYQVRYSNKFLNERDNFQPLIEYGFAYAKNKESFNPNKPTTPYDTTKFKFDIKELKTPDRTFKLDDGRKVDVFQKGSFEINEVSEEETESLGYFKETWITGSIYSDTGHGTMYKRAVEPFRDLDGNGALYKIDGLGEDGLGFRYMTNPRDEKGNYGKMMTKIPLETKEAILKGSYDKEIPIINFYDISPQVGNIRHEGGVPFNKGKKPETMLNHLMKVFTNSGDIVLDFFAGSGSTGAVAHKRGLQYVLVEQMDYVEDTLVNRLINVISGDRTGVSSELNWQGGGSFVYCEIKENAQTLIDAIQKATEGNISIIKTEIYNDKRIVPYLTREELLEVDKDFESLSLKDKKKALIKLVDKNKLYINYSDIDDEDFNISEEDKKFSRSFYEVD